MAYSIKTKDGITINNIPDDVPRDAPELKQRVAAIRAERDGATDAPTDERTLTGDMVRGAGLAARSVLEGGASLPLALTDLASYPINAIARGLGHDEPIPNSAQQTFSRGLSEMGLPEPQSQGEEMGSAIGRGAASVAGPLGIASHMSRAASPVVAGVGNTLASAPGVQLAAGAGAGGSADLARQAGYGPVGQTIAGLVGGLGVGTPAAILAPQRTVSGIAGARTTPPNPQEVALLQQVDSVAQAGAQKVGLNWDMLEDGLKAQIRQRVADSVDLDSDLTPDAVVRMSIYESLGIQPTRAMVTRSFDDAMSEQNLLVRPEGDALRDIYAKNNQAIRQNIEELNTGDRSATPSPEFGREFRAPIVKGERKVQELTNKAYNKAMDMEGDKPTNVQPLVDFLQRNGGVIASTEAGRPIVARLRQLGVINDKNMVPLEPTAQSPAGGLGYNAIPITLRDLSALRREVNAAWKGAKGPEKAQLNEMRQILNSAEDQAGGDLFKAYRVLRTKKGKRYENNPLIDDLLSDKRGYFGTDKIADSEVYKKAVLNSTVEQFEKTWPRLLPQAKALTRAQVAKDLEDRVFSNMGTNESGDVVASAAKLNRALDSIGPQKLRMIFGAEKARKLDRLNTAVREISNPPRGTVPQGSSPMLQQLFGSIVSVLGATTKIPGLGTVLRAGASPVVSAMETKAATQGAQRATDLLPALRGEVDMGATIAPVLPPLAVTPQN